ncbi:MAG TPA: hypothetical protein VMS93_03375, partial [Candidatus Saccharimonadales bacterium]|nr:hypothetical protein [Candidatus Saccharimonadales bacterium]
DQQPIGFGDTSSVVMSMPDLLTRRQTLELEVNYLLAPGLHLGAHYAFDEYLVKDWQLQDNPNLSPASGTLSAVLLGDNLFGYFHAHRFAVIVKKDL